MSETVTANDGTQLPLDSLTQTFTYSGSNVTGISVQYTAISTGVLSTFLQTFTYSGSNVNTISGWILQ